MQKEKENNWNQESHLKRNSNVHDGSTFMCVENVVDIFKFYSL